MKTVLFALTIGIVSLSYAEEVRILIDPGHGGSDPGKECSHNHKNQEKELNLAIAKKLGNYLETLLNGVTVEYTRISDIYPTLDNRVSKANTGAFDLILSIHCNSAKNQTIHGVETHINSYENVKAYSLARQIDYQMTKRAGRKSRGIKVNADRKHSLQILKYTKIPSVLVECGFMSNFSEGNYLNSEYGQDILASAIFRAVRTYLGKDGEKNQNVTSPPSVKSVAKTYQIQLMSSQSRIDLTHESFEHINKQIRIIEVEGTYKYIYVIEGFESIETAKSYQTQLKRYGFSDTLIRRS